jgi:hypothetical protein
LLSQYWKVSHFCWALKKIFYIFGGANYVFAGCIYVLINVYLANFYCFCKTYKILDV